MTLHLGLPHAHQRNAEQQHEVREARRMLKERIQDDWDYPPLPAYQTPTAQNLNQNHSDARVAGFKFHAPSNHDRERPAAELGFEPAEWRERDYSSEEDGEEAEAEVKQGKTSGEARKTSTSSADHHKKLSSIFKFEGPDSVGQQIEERKVAKRRKRQQALDEEVEWNDGLAHWLARRDTWCCARSTTQVRALESNDKVNSSQSRTSVDAATQNSAVSDATTASPRTSTSTASSITPSAATSSPSTTPDIAPAASPSSGPPKQPQPQEQQQHSASLAAPSAAPPSHTLIPLAPALLPNHPIRKRITPTLYPEIYSKIIISGRTPSVPINLLTLTRALVQGWKEDGEWPPKPAQVEKSIGRKKGTSGSGESSLRHGVRAVGRVLRITGTGAERERERERDKG